MNKEVVPYTTSLLSKMQIRRLGFKEPVQISHHRFI